jgi:prepilin-type processing-associated H-X9-DG protein
MFTRDRGIRKEEIRDGLSNTILVVEVKHGVPWSKPAADLEFDQMSFRINGNLPAIGSCHRDGANVVFADCRLSTLKDTVDSDTLRNLLQPADGGNTRLIE